METYAVFLYMYTFSFVQNQIFIQMTCLGISVITSCTLSFSFSRISFKL